MPVKLKGMAFTEDELYKIAAKVLDDEDVEVYFDCGRVTARNVEDGTEEEMSDVIAAARLGFTEDCRVITETGYQYMDPSWAAVAIEVKK
jgi:hypothetical protein